MNTQEEYIKKLETELIERSARIDLLVVESRNAEADKKLAYAQELDELRLKQQETTKILQELEKTSRDVWENIGDGG
ncbi:MAG: sll1863 family stress response protein [Methylococcaceae bacterium]